MKKLTKEEFIKKANEIHGNKYDYSKVEYVNNSTKVCIICPLHGDFWQIPQDHLKKHGCPSCAGVRFLGKENFIKKAKEIHSDKYDYSKVEYVNSKSKVCIICPEHGEFFQKPNSHLNGQGCPLCCKNKKSTKEEFIKKANEIHGNKYDYSKVEYTNSHKKVCIICKKHGEFWQTPSMHLNGHGCDKCAKENIAKKHTLTTEEFIKRAKEIHGDKYDYSKVNYVNNKTKICIVCPVHGEFWQSPNYHLAGCGCYKCSLEQNINENKLFKKLIITFKTDIIRQKTFKWLKNKGNLKLDFYLPEYNIAIEYQGEQHFKPIKHFGGVKKYLKQLCNDNIKKELCEKHGIKLIYFTYNKEYNSENIITNFNDLISKINENRNLLQNTRLPKKRHKKP